MIAVAAIGPEEKGGKGGFKGKEGEGIRVKRDGGGRRGGRERGKRRKEEGEGAGEGIVVEGGGRGGGWWWKIQQIFKNILIKF